MTWALPPLAYLLSCVLLWQGLRRDIGPERERWLVGGQWLGLAASVAHLLLLGQQATSARGIDLHFFAALSAVAGFVALFSAVLALRRAPFAALGLVIYPLASACLLGYALRGPGHVSVAAPTWQIQLHAALALLAYATLSVAALIALMLWLQERALRRRQLTTAQHVFPPLTLLESLLFRVIAGGFALLTLALLSGVVFVENLFAQHLWHKTVLSLLAWGVFGALLLGRWRYGWRGRRAVRLTLTAMALLALAFFGSKFVLELVLSRNATTVAG